MWHLTQAGERGRCLQSAVQPDQGQTSPPEGLGLDAVAWLTQLKNACRIRALRRQALVGKGVTFHELTANVANLSWSLSGVSGSKDVVRNNFSYLHRRIWAHSVVARRLFSQLNGASRA